MEISATYFYRFIFLSPVETVLKFLSLRPKFFFFRVSAFHKTRVSLSILSTRYLLLKFLIIQIIKGKKAYKIIRPLMLLFEII
jgi:hypothetical protein